MIGASNLISEENSVEDDGTENLVVDADEAAA